MQVVQNCKLSLNEVHNLISGGQLAEIESVYIEAALHLIITG